MQSHSLILMGNPHEDDFTQLQRILFKDTFHSSLNGLICCVNIQWQKAQQLLFKNFPVEVSQKHLQLCSISCICWLIDSDWHVIHRYKIGRSGVQLAPYLVHSSRGICMITKTKIRTNAKHKKNIKQ